MFCSLNRKKRNPKSPATKVNNKAVLRQPLKPHSNQLQLPSKDQSSLLHHTISHQTLNQSAKHHCHRMFFTWIYIQRVLSNVSIQEVYT